MAKATSAILPLEAGDHLDQALFHEQYKAMPSGFRAELIGGIVIVPSPLSSEHGEYHALVMTWLGHYWIATPGTRTRDNATAILSNTSEPQPDAALIIDPAYGGQTGVSDDGYATGPPELIVEIASSSASIDLHAKRRDYEQAGVLEYGVVVIRQGHVRWFTFQDGQYQDLAPDEDSIIQSTVFPGLWLHTTALLELDGLTVMQTLQQGMATPEYATFRQQLQPRHQI